jgi:hypothetical protein
MSVDYVGVLPRSFLCLSSSNELDLLARADLPNESWNQALDFNIAGAWPGWVQSTRSRRSSNKISWFTYGKEGSKLSRWFRCSGVHYLDIEMKFCVVFPCREKSIPNERFPCDEHWPKCRMHGWWSRKVKIKLLMILPTGCGLGPKSGRRVPALDVGHRKWLNKKWPHQLTTGGADFW